MKTAPSADSRDELIDVLDDLGAELVGPTRWPGTFLALAKSLRCRLPSA